MEKIYFETYGCALNQADTETMMGILKKANYEITSSIKNSDLIIINTCTVKGPTDNKLLKRLKKLPKKPTIIAGCFAQTQYNKLKGYSLLGTHQIPLIAEVVEETLNKNNIIALTENKQDLLEFPRIKTNKFIEIVPISSGCLGNCTYCLTKQARGELFSYKKDLIIKRIILAVKQGAKEIWLTSQDVGAYGLDKNSSLPKLLKEIIKIPGKFKIRLGMANPNHIINYLPELIEIFKSPKLYKFLHIPVQSGNNQVLKNMNRKYTAEDFKKIIQTLKKTIPNITITTDIICGFPGETDSQFQDTLTLIRETKPDNVNISKFWKRPNTKAAKMKQTPGEKIKERSRKMTSAFEWNSYQNNKKWLDWQGSVLISEKGKDNTFIARNNCYKQIILQGNYQLGQIIKVKIIKNTIHDLRAVEI